MCSLCVPKVILRYSGIVLGELKLVKQEHQMVKSVDILILSLCCMLRFGWQMVGEKKAALLVINDGHWQL